MKILGIIVLIILIVVIIGYSVDSGKKEVYQWAKEKGVEVKSIEVHMTQIGTPFYYLNKGTYIYEVDLTNGEKWWCRTGLFNNDWEKDKNTNSIK